MMANVTEQSKLEQLYNLISDNDVDKVIEEIRAIVGDGVSISELVENHERPDSILEKLRKNIPLQLVLDLNPLQLCNEMGKEFDSEDMHQIIDDVGAFISNVIHWAIVDLVATRADDYDLSEELIVFGKGFSAVEDIKRVEDNTYVVKTDSGTIVVFVSDGGKINHLSEAIAEKEQSLIIQFMEKNNIQDPRIIKAKTYAAKPDHTTVAICPDQSIRYLKIAISYVPSEFEYVQKFDLPDSYKGESKICYVFSDSEKEMLAFVNIIRLMEDSNIADCFEQDIQSHIVNNGVEIYQM
jgi:hypothetical protein